MAGFAARYVVAQDGAFQARTGIALVRIAYQVLGESTPGKHALNTKRWALARLILADPVLLAQRFALLAAALDVPADVADESLEQLLWQGYDRIAGVTPEDL